jgi:hypothetical protein
MTLSGNLGFVPLDEVLRLLARSGNVGVVEITNGKTRGRIFVAGEGIGLATTLDDLDLRDHLISSGYLRPEDAATRPGDTVPFNDDLVAIVREMSVESIYRMDGDDADFEVVSEAKSPYAAPEPFDLERMLDDGRKRAGQWEKVTTRVPDLEATLRMNRALTRETVELDRESWRLMSEIGSGASVKDLASRLGTTDFAVASVAASMVDNDLLVVESHAPVEEASVAPVYEEEPVSPVDSEIDPDRSWWDEPETEPTGATVSEDHQDTEELAAESDDVETHQTAETTDADDDVDDAEDVEDTEAFLEKVFSEVGSEPTEEDGHGLMRRRRMGSILRELGEE